MKINKLLLFALLLAFMSSTGLSAPGCNESRFIEAPYQCTILKNKKSLKKRFGDIMTTGRFKIYKGELVNQDSENHLVDYSCFCLTDNCGAEYEVQSYATMVKQTAHEDISFRDVDIYGFNNQVIKSKFKMDGG